LPHAPVSGYRVGISFPPTLGAIPVIDFQALMLDPLYAALGVPATITIPAEDIEAATAAGTLTFIGQPADGQTVTIGSRTYTFRTTLSSPGAVGDVTIAASAALTLFNLHACLRPPENGGGPGLDYALANVLQAVPHHPEVDSVAPIALTFNVTAKTEGAAGNGIITTTTVTGASWTAATLTGGVDEGAAETEITDLTVIDKTGGVTIGDHDAQIDTLEPACCIRHAELIANTLTISDIDGAAIAFNGSRWKIKGASKRPVPNGAKKGEVLLILANETELDSSS
jgi:hypothetical protein